MHLEKLDLNLLVALDALMRKRSVTAAAAELNLTQSAVSSALKRVRLHYGDEILYFDGQRMVPTPFGTELEAIVPDMIASLRGLSRMRAVSDLGRIERKFSVIASDYVSVVYVSELTRRLAEVAPGVSLSVIPFTDQAVRQFGRGAIDFMVGPVFAGEQSFRADLLFEDQFKCVLSRDNPVAQTGLTREAFLNSPHIVTNFFLDDGKSHFERWLQDQDLQIRVAASLPSFVVLPHFIAGTRNIATIHQRLVPHFEQLPGLMFFDAPIPIPPLQEILYTKGQLTHDSVARLMRNLMLDVGRDLRAS